MIPSPLESLPRGDRDRPTFGEGRLESRLSVGVTEGPPIMDPIITDDERRGLQDALRNRSGAVGKQVASENSRDGRETYFWQRIEGAHQRTEAAQPFREVAGDVLERFAGVESMADFLQVTPMSVIVWDQLVDREIRSGTFTRALGLRPSENRRRGATDFDRDI